jgi:type IV pilus assembly protein PilC
MSSSVVNLRRPLPGRMRIAPKVPEQRDLAARRGGGQLPVWIQDKVTKASQKSRARAAMTELPVFTRQLGKMVAAGLTLDEALEGLAGQTRNLAMAYVIQDVRRRVEAGASFSGAIAAHPKVFSQVYLAMVSSGERAGLLTEVLARLAKMLENSARLRRKVKSALIYPILVIIVALLVASFLLMSVLPVFGEVFRSFGATLPAPTCFMIALGTHAKHYLPVTLLASGALTYLWLYFISTPLGRYVWDSRRIRLPILGDIAHKLCLARFARTFGSLVRSGVPLLEALNIAAKTAGNVLLERAIKSAAVDIEQGQMVSYALSKHPVFPDMIVRMVASGEQTGEIDNMLENVADFLDEETETTIGGLTVLIEPMLIVFLGVVMGGMVVCMFLPIFKLPEIVGGSH